MKRSSARRCRSALAVLLLAAGPARLAAAEPVRIASPPESDSLLAGGAPIVGVEFSGHAALSTAALERAVASLEGRPWNGALLGRALDQVLAAYQAAGRLHAAVVEVEIVAAGEAGGGGARLRFVIDEGPPVLLGRVELAGNGLHGDEEILDLLGLREGVPFSPARFAAGVERLLGVYENEGRPYAAVEPRDLVWDDAVRFTLAVHEGPRVEIGRVRVAGNQLTRAAVVERIAGLRAGELFAQTRLDEAEARLRRSGLFAAVEPIELMPGADRTAGDLLVRVREGRTNAVLGSIGYGGAERGVTGLFDLGLGNLAGTGRRLGGRWEGRGAGVAIYELRYGEPWILGSPLTGRFELGRTIQDTLYTRTSVAVRGEMELGQDLTGSAGFERESTVQSVGAVSGTARNALLLGGVLDTRDSRLNPTRGLRMAAEVRLARKRLSLRDGSGERSVGAELVSGEAERVQAHGRRWVALVRARGAGILSDEETIPLYETFPLGGAHSLRGYREEQFRGSSTFLLQLEERYLLDPEGSRLVGFVDLGHVSTSGTTLAQPGEPTRLFRVGYGAGLRLATRLGLVGLDYGLGEGDGPLAGKLHVGLEAAF